MALSRVTFLMDDAMRAEFEANMKVGGFRTQQEAFESMFKCKKREATAEVEAVEVVKEGDEFS